MPVAWRDRLRDEGGAVGGLEVLPFGLLIFVVGILLVVNAWAVVDAKLAAEAAAREAARAPLVVSDLHLTYVGFGRVGPVRTQADVLRATPGAATTRVRLVDEGAERRLMTLVTAVATEGFPA
jgi:hypothetical protein